MGYRLGKRSLKRLEGLHPDLVRVVKKAITLTNVDFTVLEGDPYRVEAADLADIPIWGTVFEGQPFEIKD